MGGYGGWNPYPFQYGGGMSDVEAVWRAMRRAVGGGKPDGLAGPEMGLEDSWRFAKSEAIAAACVGVEHAAFQSLPNRATDSLPVYEALLFVPQEPTDQQRRDAVTKVYTLQLAADIPNIVAELAKIDTAALMLTRSYDICRYVQFGRSMGDRDGSPAYGLNGASDWPNFSDDFVVYIQYTMPPGAVNADQGKIAAIERFLRDVLPAWVDFEISVVASGGGTGFFLDGGSDGTSLLDQTAFD